MKISFVYFKECDMNFNAGILRDNENVGLLGGIS